MSNNQFGSFTLANPGVMATSGSELQIVAPTGGSSNKFTIYGWENATPVAHVRFTLRTTSTNTGTFGFQLGTGLGVFQDNSGFTSYGESFVAFSLAYNTSGVLTTVTRRNLTTNTPVTTHNFAEGVDQVVEVFANNNAVATTYFKDGSTYTLTAQRWDLWVAGTKISPAGGFERALPGTGGIAAGTSLAGIGFFAESSAGNAMTIYLDDLYYNNALPACIPPAITSATSNSPICSDEELFLSVTATGTEPLTYSWTGTGEITNAGTTEATVTGAATGNYIISVSNECGTVDQDVAVTVDPLPDVTCPADLVICSDAVAFELAGGGPEGGTYTGDGVEDGEFDPALAGTGSHTITYTVTENGCTAFCTFSITVNETPEVSCPANEVVCEADEPFELTGGAPAGGVYSGLGVDDGMFDPAAAGAGTHIITYSYTAENECLASCFFEITVNATPPVTCPEDMAVCINDEPFELSGGSPAGGTHTSAAAVDGIFDPQAAGEGSHIVEYEVIAANGCVAMCSYEIFVHPDTDGDGICDPFDECPLVPGQIDSFCDADPSPGQFSLGRLDEDCNCQPIPCTIDVTLEVQTHTQPEEISWEITPDDSQLVICSGTTSIPNSTEEFTCCLAEGCFKLRVLDTAGDGMTTGGYILRLPGIDGARIIDNRDNFSSGTHSEIDNDYSFCLPIGQDRPIYTSCDKLDWMDNQFIVASLNSQVSAQWQDNQPYTAQDPTSGYEFWFFDPNGGYSHRVFKSLANPSGIGATYARAAHLLINNWAAANHIPHNQLMNVRVRGVVNGDTLDWGPACRFMIDPAAASCPRTKLMDIPGNIHISCGQFRLWATNQGVHARPVRGATQYEFRFEREGVFINRITNTYWVRFGWSAALAPPLMENTQYNVDVRAFVNGQWCDWGKVCILNMGVPMQGGTQNMLADDQELQIDMWPNPNRGDLLNIRLDGTPTGLEQVVMDMYDMQGRRIMATQIAVNPDAAAQVVQLPGNMAPGMYLVNIIAGEMMITHRLVVE